MRATEEINIVGKDWLTEIEAAHYCGVSRRQFCAKRAGYGLVPHRFMGKKLYAKDELCAAIRASEDWYQEPDRTIATAVPPMSDPKLQAIWERLGNVRLRPYVPRKLRVVEP